MRMKKSIRSTSRRARPDPRPERSANPADSVTSAVGAELRRLRKAQGKTLAELALHTGFSVGFVSQAERGLSPISISALQTLGQALGVPIGWFFGNGNGAAGGEDESDIVVRAGRRKRIDHGELGIVDYLLSPNLKGSLEVLLSEFAPGATSGGTPYTHNGEEAGLVLEGVLDLWVGERHFHLRKGDSFTFRSSIPHRYRNPAKRPARVLWIITPPSF